MALYAFDGTWNTDSPDAEKNTNVIKFREAYAGKVFYREGVGTRFGPFGKLIGGMTGAGGRERINEAMDALRENFIAGDTVVDVIGFSRGAALAVHFANQVAKGFKEVPADSAVRFLGVWDIVADFGVPGNNINIDWDLGVGPTVQNCFHAMALDERRVSFPQTRLSNADGRAFEVWFRGVHSDVGGGDPDLQLSSIALNWMYRSAIRSGLIIKGANVDANVPIMNADADISHHTFELGHLFKNIHREIFPSDVVHVSVRSREGSQYNNPPANLARMNDDGQFIAAAGA